MSGDEPVGGIDQAREELTDELELADGETVRIPEDDAVQPIVGKFHTDTQVTVQQDRIKMTESGRAKATVAVPKRSIEEPETFGSIFSPVRFGTKQDDVYAELSFENAEQMRRLRDALNIALRYRGEYDGE